MRLANKVAIITGAGSGIGREVALLFAREGACVVLTGRTKEKIESVRQEIKKEGGKAIYVQGDVTSSIDMKNVVNEAVGNFGRIDILINNAGINQDALVSRMTEEQWDKVIKVDLKGAFNCIRVVLGVMLNRGRGVIISASSISGILAIMKEKTPLQRLGGPADIAYAYLYLASDEARFVNGAVLRVDGGLTI